MSTGLSEFAAVALAAIVLGFVALSLLVHRELGPFAGLDTGGKWLLTLAFGLGLCAFSLKLVVALLIGGLAQPSLAALVTSAPRPEVGETPGEFINPAPRHPARYVWEALPERAPEPPDNPGTPEKIALGRRLFLEKRLSGDGTLACASCHDLLGQAGADGQPTARGIAGQRGPRNTPTVWNAAFQSVLFWDGRSPSLEDQAGGPILNPLEMGLASPREAERRLTAAPGYRAAFARAFGDAGPITFSRIRQALAAYERTLITPDSPYDRFVRGQADALDEAQLRGMALFESKGCVLCHRGPNFSDASHLGGESPLRLFPANASAFEERYPLLLEDGRRGVWRIPSLRNVALTGPWLHNGSVDRLEEVVRIMASAQLGRSGGYRGWLGQDDSLTQVDRTPLNDREVADVVAFLKALSSATLGPGGGPPETPLAQTKRIE